MTRVLSKPAFKNADNEGTDQTVHLWSLTWHLSCYRFSYEAIKNDSCPEQTCF